MQGSLSLVQIQVRPPKSYGVCAINTSEACLSSDRWTKPQPFFATIAGAGQLTILAPVFGGCDFIAVARQLFAKAALMAAADYNTG